MFPARYYAARFFGSRFFGSSETPAEASGALLVAAASLIDGTATGDLPAVVLPLGGGSFRLRRAYLDEEEQEDAVAPSAVVSSRVVLVAGTATGSAVAAAYDE